MKDIDFLIKKFNLQPHLEGGYFKETYRSVGAIEENSLPTIYNGKRNYSTCIYFLLTSDTFSAFHKIKQDEIWHFYAGSPLKLFMISDEGDYSEKIIGADFKSGQFPQFVVPGGYWFGAKTLESDSYSFVGCTVSPGFDFEDLSFPVKQNFWKSSHSMKQ
ncbi:cupin domain-containing protein [Flagellimonas sp. S174]|uniref:cupin domain-containing protein n=1 Tax=Flagellimonas sp. S174 TaxID=3410790 RepID=UPI003BF4B535